MITFEVNDMGCSHCVGAITRALHEADRDAQVQVDLETHRVCVVPAAADAAMLQHAIAEAGYTPVPV